MSKWVSDVYVGLGTNLGDRADNLRRALARLEGAPGIRLVAVSDVYETAPWGYAEQPSFLNAVSSRCNSSSR